MDTECGINCKRDCADNCKNYSLKRSLFNALQQHDDLFGYREDLMIQTVEKFTEIIDSTNDSNIDNNLRNILVKFTTDLMNRDLNMKNLYKSELEYANKLLGNNNIKDNPVPSLSKEDKHTILTALKNYNEDMCGDDEIIELIKKINGVETNKEQPKYLVMHSNYPIAFCSDKKKFLEEEMPDDEERELTEFIPIKLGNIDD